MRWGPCWYGQAAVNRNDAGSIPATAALDETEGQAGPIQASMPDRCPRWHPARTRTSSCSLARSTPAPSALRLVPLAERQRFQASNLARRVRLPQGTLEMTHDPGSSLLVVMPDFESGVRRFDSYPRNLFANTSTMERVANSNVLRDRLTVGWDALNVLVLVRFQPPRLESKGRKSSGWMRSLS